MDLQVGQKRKFSFNEEDCVIHEIIDRPEVQMIWEYDSGVCPHCKKKLQQRRNHTFIKIEILIPENITKENVTIDDLVLLGITNDGKNLLITKDKYNEIFAKSKLFSDMRVEE